MNGSRLNIRYLVIGLAFLFSIACSSISSLAPATEVPPTSTDTPLPTATATLTPTLTPTPLPNYDGIWNGTTSQDKQISITVENNEVVSLAVEVDMQGNGCTSNTKSLGGMSGLIVEGTFEATLDLHNNSEYTINGKFDSEVSVSGSLQYSQSSGCPGTVEVEWSATKETSGG